MKWRTTAKSLKVKSVQRGYIRIEKGAGVYPDPATIKISPVNYGRSSIRVTLIGESVPPYNGYYHLGVNSSAVLSGELMTSLIISGNYQGADGQTKYVYWEVIEYAANVKIQRGMASGSHSAPIEFNIGDVDMTKTSLSLCYTSITSNIPVSQVFSHGSHKMTFSNINNNTMVKLEIIGQATINWESVTYV